jgi:hypothetical protein
MYQALAGVGGDIAPVREKGCLNFLYVRLALSIPAALYQREF